MSTGLDHDGYPLEETLALIKNWRTERGTGIATLLGYVADCWYYPDRAQEVRPGIWTFSTGGWSGNEELLQALVTSAMWMIYGRDSIALTGGFLCVAVTKDAKVEMEDMVERIVVWGWRETPVSKAPPLDRDRVRRVEEEGYNLKDIEAESGDSGVERAVPCKHCGRRRCTCGKEEN